MILFVVLACGARPAEVDASPPVGPAPVPQEVASGSWISSNCGERAWSRVIVFDTQGRFAGQDLVSPCPKGATCIWSGVVERAGSWASVQGKVQLVLDQPGSMPVAEPMATWVQPQGEQIQDDLGCLYMRVSGESE